LFTVPAVLASKLAGNPHENKFDTKNPKPDDLI
jgi:hypothetical protein